MIGILVLLLIGAGVGWVALQLLGREEGLAMSIIVGIIGAFIGSFVSKAITGTDQAYLAPNVDSLFWALIGALIFVAILNVFSHSHHSAS